MNRIFIAVFGLLPTLAIAQDGAQITIAEAIATRGALAALSGGYQKIIKDGANEHAIQTQYEFSPGVRAAIARDIVRLQAVLQPAMMEAQQALKAICPTGLTKCPDDAAEAYRKEEAASLKRTLVVDFVRLTEQDLALDKNPIPPETLAALGAAATFK